jgi:hypothetical protein
MQFCCLLPGGWFRDGGQSQAQDIGLMCFMLSNVAWCRIVAEQSKRLLLAHAAVHCGIALQQPFSCKCCWWHVCTGYGCVGMPSLMCTVRSAYRRACIAQLVAILQGLLMLVRMCSVVMVGAFLVVACRVRSSHVVASPAGNCHQEALQWNTMLGHRYVHKCNAVPVVLTGVGVLLSAVAM